MLKNIIITAGGTIEKVDNVRNIRNMSTGKLGAIICNTILANNSEFIEKIYYITTKHSVMPENNKKIEFIYITGVEELKQVAEKLLKNYSIDYFIHSMAVSDYTVDYVSDINKLSDEVAKAIINIKGQDITQEELKEVIKNVMRAPNSVIDRETKISSFQDNMFIYLKQAPKVISFIKNWSPDIKLIGFKLLSNVLEKELIDVATKLLEKNNCDYVIANDLSTIKNGTHKAFILDKEGKRQEILGKQAIAEYISDIIKDN